MRRDIDTWWPAIKAAAEAIVKSPSSCGAMVKKCGHLLRHDAGYTGKAVRGRQPGQAPDEGVAGRGPEPAGAGESRGPLLLHPALGFSGVVKMVLHRVGVELAQITNGHLCCESPGTYSVLQSEISRNLLDSKLRALMIDRPA